MATDKKTTHQDGFTLAELLIVVAIIAILVAISIPIFTSQLKKARLATDKANVRSAKAAAAAAYMTDDEDGSSMTYLYDGSKAIAVTSDNLSQISAATSGDGYGKSEADANKKDETGAAGDPKNNYVEVTINNDQKMKAIWTAGGAIFDGYSGKLTLTGKLVNNGNILSEIKSLGLEPSQITDIEATDGAKIDSDTEKVFEGLPNLKTIDLSKATLVHSSQYMFSETPSTVTQIALPKCSSPYNIAGVWYYADGTREGAKWSNGLSESTGTRIETGHDGAVIYRKNPKG